MIDPRAADQITYSRAMDVIRFRPLMTGAGYEDGQRRQQGAQRIRCSRWRSIFRPSIRSCARSRQYRGWKRSAGRSRALLVMGRAMVDLPVLVSPSPRFPTKRINTLDIDDTFDAVHGGQRVAALFNAHYDEYGFQPIVVKDGEGRFVTAVLRPAKRPSGSEIKRLPEAALLRAIRAHWPTTEILLAAGRRRSHYCGSRGSRLVSRQWPRLHPRQTSNRDIAPRRRSRSQRHEGEIWRRAAADGKLRRFMEFFDGAQSWSRVERIIMRAEAGAELDDLRFVVTNLSKRNARHFAYEDASIATGAWPAGKPYQVLKTSIWRRADQCHPAPGRQPTQFRLFLHAGAYWLMWGSTRYCRCQSVRCGASPSSTRNATSSSRLTPASSR